MIDRLISGDFVIVSQTRTVPHQERSIFFLKDGLTILSKEYLAYLRVMYCTVLPSVHRVMWCVLLFSLSVKAPLLAEIETTGIENKGTNRVL